MKLAPSISTAAMCHFEAKPRNLSSGRSLTEFYPESVRRVRDDSMRLLRAARGWHVARMKHRAIRVLDYVSLHPGYETEIGMQRRNLIPIRH
jgi:hypothetical protein